MGLTATLLGITMQVVACAVLALALAVTAHRSPRPWIRWWAATFALAAMGLGGVWMFYRTGAHLWMVVYGPLVVAASAAMVLGLVELIDSPWWRRTAPPMALALVAASALAAALLDPSAWFLALSVIQVLIIGTAGAIVVGAVLHTGGRSLLVAGILIQVAAHLFYLATNLSGLHQEELVPYGLMVDLAAELLIGCGLLMVAHGVEYEDVSRRASRLQQVQDQLVQISEVDPLTGSGTRHALRSWFESWDESRSLSLLLLDIDHLDRINQRHGREAGDRALKMIADILQQACTGNDLVVRWQEDEFLAVMQDTESSSAVRHLARLMRLLDDSLTSFPYPTPLRVSWGVATCQSKDGISKAIAHAEHQMQAMKTRRRRERDRG